MITTTAWAGKRYAVLGLARSGAATVRALLASGAEVLAWDDEHAKHRAVTNAAKSASNADRLFVDDFTDWIEFELDGLVLSPGVPLNRLPLADIARDMDVPILGDIELFAQARADLPPHKVVGITGTNGKSTTTALIHHILTQAGISARMGGNIGLPILEQAPLPTGGIYVLELSSYQIDLTYSLDCDVAVLLNITPDHLDRYAGFDAYAASKARLFAMQSAAHTAIVGMGDAPSRAIADRLGDRAIRIAVPADLPSFGPALAGPHNAQNALAAIAACEALGIDRATIEAALKTYHALPHRMAHVADVNGVAYVDDSKATNPESTAPALNAFPRIHWIVGGLAKGDDLDACRPGFANVVRAYTIGQASERFAELLGPDLRVEIAGTLDEAVRSAATQAQPGDTVLLSPACASFDQFSDYEARGRAFAAAVEALR